MVTMRFIAALLIVPILMRAAPHAYPLLYLVIADLQVLRLKLIEALRQLLMGAGRATGKNLPQLRSAIFAIGHP